MNRENPEPTVFIVDDDPAMRRSLQLLVESIGLSAELYESGEVFLEQLKSDRPGCVIMDVRMPGKSGMDLQDELAKSDESIQIIFISAHGTVPMALRTIKAGALHFFEKPFDSQEMVDCIQYAIQTDATARAALVEKRHIQKGLDQLTTRERQVLDMVVAGKVNKIIGHELGISERTVENHRANIMKKMNASSIADLIRATLITG